MRTLNIHMLDTGPVNQTSIVTCMLLTRSTGYIKDMDNGDVTLILIGLGD